MRPVHETIDFLVDDGGSLLTVFTRACRQGRTREWVFALAERDRSNPFAPTPARNHLPRNRCDTLQFVFIARRDLSNRHFLCATPTESRHQFRLQLLLRLLLAPPQRDPSRPPTRLPTPHTHPH